MPGRKEGVGFQTPAVNGNGSRCVFREVIEQAAQQKTDAVNEGLFTTPVIDRQNVFEVFNRFFIVARAWCCPACVL